MRFPRRFSGRIAAIIALIAFSVLAIVSIGEGFKAVLIRRDGAKLDRRDGSSTVTLNVPWQPVHVAAKPESKDVFQDIGDSLIGDIAAVASAILGGGSEVASAASAGAAGLEATPLQAGSSVLGDGTASVSSILREVNGQIQQATSIVGAIVGDATSIVGSILAAATSPSNIGVLPHVNSNSSMNRTTSSSANVTSSTMGERQVFCTTCNSSHPTFSYNTTITAMPCPSSAISLATTGFSITSTTPSCPSPITETCTVTETWHSTHYAETATFYSFVANSTVTYTETISICPPSLIYLPAPMSTVPPLQGLIACANGILAKRQEDCPSMLNMTSLGSLNTFISASGPASSPTTTNPCPNAGYSCAECPDGWFCPPHPTPAQDCICGYGWACANCKGGYFCIPSPPTLGNGLMNTVTSLLVTSAASSMPSNMRSFTTSPPTLQSLGTAVPMPTGTVTCIDGSVVMMAKDCLNGVSGATVNTLDITIINEPMAADLAAATGANSLAGCLLSNAKADVSSIVGNPQLAIAAGLTSASGNILPTVATGDILPTATAILSNAPNSILSSIAKHIPNAGESMLNQLMNGAPTNLPASPQPPALGIAKGRRRG